MCYLIELKTDRKTRKPVECSKKHCIPNRLVGNRWLWFCLATEEACLEGWVGPGNTLYNRCCCTVHVGIMVFPNKRPKFLSRLLQLGLNITQITACGYFWPLWKETPCEKKIMRRLNKTKISSRVIVWNTSGEFIKSKFPTALCLTPAASKHRAPFRMWFITSLFILTDSSVWKPIRYDTKTNNLLLGFDTHSNEWL